MKVVVVNGSLKGDDAMAKLIESAVMGLKSAGEPVEVELVRLASEEVAFCTACGRCWVLDGKPLGDCPLTGDRMRELLVRMLEADRIVLATPLVLGTVTSVMKRFLERCLPLTYNSKRGRRARTKRVKGKKGGVVIVHSFFPVVSHIVGKVRGPEAMLKLVLKAAGCESIKTVSVRLPRLPPYRIEGARGRAFHLGLELAKQGHGRRWL